MSKQINHKQTDVFVSVTDFFLSFYGDIMSNGNHD